MSDCDDEFWKARMVKIAQAIEAYEDALIFFATNNATQSYTLDTGQTRTTVMRSEISSLKNTLESLMSLYDDLCARTNGCAVIQLRPTR